MSAPAYWLYTSYVVPRAEVTGRVDDYEVLDDSHLRVTVTITNSGNVPASVNCLLHASIPRRLDALGGFEDDLAKGQSKAVAVELDLPSDAAKDVTAVSVDRCTASPDYSDP